MGRKNHEVTTPDEQILGRHRPRDEQKCGEVIMKRAWGWSRGQITELVMGGGETLA